MWKVCPKCTRLLLFINVTYCGLLDFIFFAKTTQIASDFFAFSIFLKWANLPLSANVQKPKMFQLQGGFAPLSP